MKLILHIGTEKTGSTTIQNWLYENKVALGDNGFFLSSSLSTPNNRSLVHCFQDEIDEYYTTQGIKDLERRNEIRDRLLADFRAEVCAQSGARHTAILTSEHFHSRLTRPDEIDRFVDFARDVFSDILIVCYFRNQLALCRSKYSTAVRAWRTETFEEYLLSNTEMAEYYDLHDLASRWTNAVGKDKVSFRNYDAIRKERRDIRRDFLEAAELDFIAESMSYASRSQNLGLSLMDANAFRLANRAFPPWNRDGTPSKLNRAAKKISLPLAGAIQRLTGRRSISAAKSIEDEVCKRFELSNERLFDEYGIDIRMPAAK